MFNLGFVMEQALGHITHHQNLARWVEVDADICPTWMPIPEHRDDRWETMPGVRDNWSLKSSLRAKEAIQKALRTQKLDALFLHTQTTALFSVPFMRKIPTIVSLDATPLNYDTVGAEYGHISGNFSWLERRKYNWNRRTFTEATALTTWCQWAKDSLIADYDIPAEKVTVIPPGVDLARWSFGKEKLENPIESEGPVRLLFVGGDFVRKGGNVLVEAFRNGLQQDCTLDIVTKEEVTAIAMAGIEGVKVHRGLTANSQPLRELYAKADIFVFPTLADCLPLAVMEAMAAGLPVIATNVGALREEVEAGINGVVVPPRDVSAIVDAVKFLLENPHRRLTMARASRQMAEERFDAQRNYCAILALMKGICGRG